MPLMKTISGRVFYQLFRRRLEPKITIIERKNRIQITISSALSEPASFNASRIATRSPGAAPT